MNYYLGVGFLAAGFLFSCESSNTVDELNDVLNDLNDSTSTEEVVVTNEITANWIDFSDEDGRFSVKMPGQPQRTSQIEPTEVGNIMIEMFMYEESATKIYIVGYNDYPSELFEDATDEEISQTLDDVLMGATSAIGLDIVDERKELDLDGVMGKMIKAKSSTNAFHAHYKAYMVNNRLYQVGMIRDGSYPMDEKSQTFFDSFKLDLESAE